MEGSQVNIAGGDKVEIKTKMDRWGKEHGGYTVNPPVKTHTQINIYTWLTCMLAWRKIMSFKSYEANSSSPSKDRKNCGHEKLLELR